jgi:hypothetical protein
MPRPQHKVILTIKGEPCESLEFPALIRVVRDGYLIKIDRKLEKEHRAFFRRFNKGYTESNPWGKWPIFKVWVDELYLNLDPNTLLFELDNGHFGNLILDDQYIPVGFKLWNPEY